MKLSNSFIAVKKISSTVPRSNFSEDNLNLAAQLILKAEGVINPLVLRRTSLQSYEVVDGHFEYYAAVRAKEIDSQKGEYIGAFIIEPDNEEVIEEQVKLLRKQSANNQEIEQGLENLPQENIKSIMYKLTHMAGEINKIEQVDRKQLTTHNTVENLIYKVDQISDTVQQLIEIGSKQKTIQNQLEVEQIADIVVQRLESWLLKVLQEINTGNTEKHKNRKTQKSQYDRLKKDELINIATKKGIKITKRMTKAEIVEFIEEFDNSQGT